MLITSIIVENQDYFDWVIRQQIQALIINNMSRKI